MRKTLAVAALTVVLTGSTTAVASAATSHQPTRVVAADETTDTNTQSDKTGLWGLLGLLGLGGLAKRKTTQDSGAGGARR